MRTAWVKSAGGPDDDVEVQAKPFWQSWTVWFNVIGVLILVAEAFLQFDFAGPDAEKWIAFGIVVGNIVLRFKTAQPVTLT